MLVPRLSIQIPTVDAGHFIGGEFVESTSTERYTSISPATGEQVGTFALGTAQDVDRAVAAATAARDGWAALSIFERIEHIERVLAVVAQRREELANLLAIEQGKPLFEAISEVDGSIENFRITNEFAKTMEIGSLLPVADSNRRAMTIRVPRGVVATIQPWNFPLGTLSGQASPALVMGNTVLALPAPSTTLIEYEYARCFADAGFPAGVFNLLTGMGAVVGDAMVSHPGVQAVAFTGSVATGQRVAARAAGKAQLIELGGNGPFVVLEDADLDLAVKDAVSSAFGAAGQSCIAAGRFLVHDAIYDEFAARLAAAAKSVVLGTPFDSATTMGPLNNTLLADKVDRHVQGAVAAGATVVLGGGRADGFPTDLYYQATVITGVTEQMPIAVEETFGPIAPIQRITSDAEALQIMRDSHYGLGSAVYTRDIARGLRFAEQAPTGMIHVNARPGDVEGHLPVGGHTGKLSGIGKIQGRAPMEDVFSELKLITYNAS